MAFCAKKQTGIYKSCLLCRNWQKVYQVHPVSLTTCPKNLHDAVWKMSKEIIRLIALHLEQKTTCNILDIWWEYKYSSNVWVALSGKLSSSMRKRHRFRFICARAKSHRCICSPLIHSIVYNYPVSGQQRP